MQIGQRVGKYEIVQVLGQGGMGVVYKAVDPGIGRTVALKVLLPSQTQSPELRERFLREAQAAGRLQHPNIVVIHDLGEDNGNLYIAMEFLEGETLAERIAREQGRCDVGSALEVMAQVGRGLNYAHERGVVHRDIKPANILVTREGTAKILDFGIARAGDKRMTKTGQVMGTIYYMSPEQINGQQLDGRSDVFSAGIVLYELLTGDVPFDAESTGATMMKILTAPAPPLSERAPMSPPALEEIVARALAKKAEERYANAAEFAAALEAAKAECQAQQQREQMRVSSEPTRPASAMSAAAGAGAPADTVPATVLHQTAPAAEHIDLKEFDGWKDDLATMPAGRPAKAREEGRIEANAEAAPQKSAAAKASPAQDLATRRPGQRACRFAAVLCLFFAAVFGGLSFFILAEPRPGSEPADGCAYTVAAFAAAVAFALIGRGVWRGSRLAAIAIPVTCGVLFYMQAGDVLEPLWEVADIESTDAPLIAAIVLGALAALGTIFAIRGTILYSRGPKAPPRAGFLHHPAFAPAAGVLLVGAMSLVSFYGVLPARREAIRRAQLSEQPQIKPYLTAKLGVTVDTVPGYYAGSLFNLTHFKNAKAEMVLAEKTQAFGSVLSGCIGVHRPLYGSGGVAGSRLGPLYRFTLESTSAVISFDGTREGGTIRGNYTAKNKADGSVENGSFTFDRSPVMSLGEGFSASDCPNDEAIR